MPAVWVVPLPESHPRVRPGPLTALPPGGAVQSLSSDATGVTLGGTQKEGRTDSGEIRGGGNKVIST